MNTHFFSAGLLLAFFPVTLAAKGKKVFLEKRGILAIEAESTSSSLRKWKKKTDVADFSGTCHLEFTGNTIMSGPPNSALKYHFKIKKPGVYRLILRARKRLENSRADLSNDCYVSVKGDFEAGGKAPLKLLKKDTKIFGGHSQRWGWARQLDSNHQKFMPEYAFKSGETYTITLSGRSKNFNLDRFFFVHESKNLREILTENPPESPLDGPQELPRVTRTITNQDGKTITAELIEFKEGELILNFKGRRISIDPKTLSEVDQNFIREWAGE